jgi:hypothetical protein
MLFSSILPSLITTLSFAVGIDAWAQVRSILFPLYDFVDTVLTSEPKGC